jgi:predicted dehydrogenase
MKILKTLSVGVSGRGQWPVKTCRPEIGFKLVALCDVNTNALASACDIANLPKSACYTDYEQALDQSDVDCVILCTPTIYHIPMAKRAIERGLPVLTEKGMAPNWSTANEAIAFVRQHNGIFCVSQNYRYNALERTFHRLLTNANDPAFIGHPYLLDLSHHRVRPEPRTLNYPYASIWDMSCHHFDNLVYWLGPVSEITAHAFAAPHSQYEHPNNTSAFMRFQNGTCVNYFHGHDSARGECRINLHGEKGAVFGCVFDQTSSTGGLQSLAFTKRPTTQFGKSDPIAIPFDHHLGEVGVLQDFHAYITQNIVPGISGYHNLEVMAMCQMMVMSIEQHRTVQRTELNDT